MSKSSQKGFFYFSVLNLTPFIILTALFSIYSLFVNAIFAFKRQSYQGLLFSLSTSFSFFIFLWLLEFFVLAVIMFICFRLFKICKTWFQRGVVLYLFWAITILILAYTIISMFTGVSMAYVDANNVSKHRMELDVVTETVIVFLIAHIFIVPWVIFCIKRLKHLMSDVFTPALSQEKGK